MNWLPKWARLASTKETDKINSDLKQVREMIAAEVKKIETELRARSEGKVNN